MKKILIGLAMMLSALAFTSCEEEEFKITYNVDIVGDADGDVTLTFPDGRLALQGCAAIDFHYGNADVADYTLTEALESNDANVVKAAWAVKEDVEKAFTVVATEGTYYIHIGGYAEAYGVKISIDETFTNRTDYAAE